MIKRLLAFYSNYNFKKKAQHNHPLPLSFYKEGESLEAN